MKGVEKLREEQNYLREEVKRLKWQEGISYKYLAEELLDMKYNSFVNFVHGYKDLGLDDRVGMTNAKCVAFTYLNE